MSLRQLRAAQLPQPVEHSRRYALGTTVHFGLFGEGSHFAATGWGQSNSLETKSKRQVATLHFHFREPTTGALALRVLLKRRHKKGVSPLSHVKVHIDGQPVTRWKLEDHAQWKRLDIPPTRNGRLGLDVAFEMEGAENSSSGIALIEACVSRNTLFHNFARMARQTWEALARRIQETNSPRISLGEEISFDAQGKGIWIAKEGWGIPKPWGMPVQGLFGRMEIPLPRRNNGPLILKVRARMLPPRAEEGRLAVEVQGKSLTVWHLHPDDAEWFEVAIPKAQNTGNLIVSLRIDRVSPFSFGIERLILDQQHALRD